MPKHRKYVFGPVHSRRLGYSLGVDIIPFKTCNLNCVYCELGRTTRETMQRREYIPADRILAEVREAVSHAEHIDYITFSGSGEPTLNSKLGEMIAALKAEMRFPIAVLTNGTLLYLPEVRESLQQADLVAPSLDAATQEVFRRIDRAHGHLNIDRIIAGQEEFRREYTGKIWLEMLFVRGINDTDAEVDALRAAVERLQPDRVQINTIDRPPAESGLQPLSTARLQYIRDVFGEIAEIIAAGPAASQKTNFARLDDEVLALAARRPVTLADLAESLGRSRDEIEAVTAALAAAHQLETSRYNSKLYYLVRRRRENASLAAGSRSKKR